MFVFYFQMKLKSGPTLDETFNELDYLFAPSASCNYDYFERD